MNALMRMRPIAAAHGLLVDAAAFTRTLTLAAEDTAVSGMKVVVGASARIATAMAAKYGRGW